MLSDRYCFSLQLRYVFWYNIPALWERFFSNMDVFCQSVVLKSSSLCIIDIKQGTSGPGLLAVRLGADFWKSSDLFIDF